MDGTDVTERRWRAVRRFNAASGVSSAALRLVSLSTPVSARCNAMCACAVRESRQAGITPGLQLRTRTRDVHWRQWRDPLGHTLQTHTQVKASASAIRLYPGARTQGAEEVGESGCGSRRLVAPLMRDVARVARARHACVDRTESVKGERRDGERRAMTPESVTHAKKHHATAMTATWLSQHGCGSV